MSKTSAGNRLSIDAIVEAAAACAARSGLDEVTMRAVAAELGASPMALYRHVADREELLDQVADRALADVELRPHPKPRQARAWLVHMATEVRGHLRAVPGTADHLLMKGPTGPHTMVFMDRVCHVLADTGRTPKRTAQAYDWLMTTIAVYIAKQDRLDRTGGTVGAAGAFAARTAAYAERLPHLRSVMKEFTGDADAAFERVVGAVVDALLAGGDQVIGRP